MASVEDNHHNDVAAIELPAPAGWSKKFTPKKGGTPQKNDIVFVSPTGEEIKSKKQLDQYLKFHPGGPAASEFEWGTGDTPSPRRSARLSEKSKAVIAPTSQSPKKKQKRSNTKGAREKSNADAEEEATGLKDAIAKESKETSTVDVANEDVIPEKPKSEDVDEKTDMEEPSAGALVNLEEPSAAAPVNSEEPSAAAPVNSEEPSAGAPVNSEKPSAAASFNLEEPSAAAPIDTEKPNDATTVVPVPDAKMEELKETSSVAPSAEADKSKEASAEVLDAKNNKTEEAANGGKETPDGKVDSAVTASEGVEDSKQQEAEEKAVEKEESLQEPTTGS